MVNADPSQSSQIDRLARTPVVHFASDGYKASIISEWDRTMLPAATGWSAGQHVALMRSNPARGPHRYQHVQVRGGRAGAPVNCPAARTPALLVVNIGDSHLV